jgi:hypothetical protein
MLFRTAIADNVDADLGLLPHHLQRVARQWSLPSTGSLFSFARRIATSSGGRTN